MREVRGKWSVLLCMGLCAVAAVSCNRPVIKGVVINAEGETLPGVAVNQPDSDYGDLTNAVGQYQVRFRTGTVVLEFAKTGYTPARLELLAESAEVVNPPLVEMWRLPTFSGVYLLENFKYREAPGLELKTFYTENDEAIVGTQRDIVLATEASEPLIVCYGMPRYDARVHRLRQIEARVAKGEEVLQPIWVAAESLPVDVLPVDQPAGVLLQLRLEAPLEPGEYAVHWGAFEGYTTLDARIFPFRVLGPEGEPTEGEVAEGVVTDGAPAEGGEPEADAPADDANADTDTEEADEEPAADTEFEEVEPERR